MIDYKTTLTKAKQIKKGVETEYKLVASTPVYYICKQILKPKTNVGEIEISLAKQSQGDYYSRQIYHSTYIMMAEKLVDYVEKNHQLPNYITDNHNKKMKVRDYVYMFSRILVYYDTNGKLPKYAIVNSKAYNKPTETGNEVYDYACKKFGKKFTSLDDILEYVANHFTYEFYYDDHKSNKQVTDTQAGNCTDLLQWLCNMVEALGYEWKCVHVSCRQSGTGHVWGKFKHPTNTSGEWVNRDIACCADNGSVRCIWCEDGYVNAYNPSWWLSNLQR